jgi:hypothetical protein
METVRVETILSALIITESKLVVGASGNVGNPITTFNESIQQHLDNDWKQHGSVFLIGDRPAVNMVRYDQRVQPMMDKVMRMVSLQMDL